MGEKEQLDVKSHIWRMLWDVTVRWYRVFVMNRLSIVFRFPSISSSELQTKALFNRKYALNVRAFDFNFWLISISLKRFFTSGIYGQFMVYLVFVFLSSCTIYIYIQFIDIQQLTRVKGHQIRLARWMWRKLHFHRFQAINITDLTSFLFLLFFIRFVWLEASNTFIW